MNTILYKLRNYEVVTKRTRTEDNMTDYSANIFCVGVPVSDKNQTELWEEFDNKADEYLKIWNENINKNEDYVCDAYISGATSQITPHGISHKDIYWNCYTNKYSSSYVKNYLKYKKCVKNHKDSIVYFTEHVENNFITSIMTEKEIEDANKGRDELVALCNNWCCNCTFIMSEIKCGLLWAIKKDIRRKFM